MITTTNYYWIASLSELRRRHLFKLKRLNSVSYALPLSPTLASVIANEMLGNNIWSNLILNEKSTKTKKKKNLFVFDMFMNCNYRNKLNSYEM